MNTHKKKKKITQGNNIIYFLIRSTMNFKLVLCCMTTDHHLYLNVSPALSLSNTNQVRWPHAIKQVKDNEQENKGKVTERVRKCVDEYGSGQRPTEGSTLFAHRAHCHATGWAFKKRYFPSQVPDKNLPTLWKSWAIKTLSSSLQSLSDTSHTYFSIKQHTHMPHLARLHTLYILPSKLKTTYVPKNVVCQIL